MPLVVLGRTRATLSAAASLVRLPASGKARPCNGVRAGDRRLQSSVSNEEFLVGAGHQPASITSLPFVHTARRYYHSNGLVRPFDSTLHVGVGKPVELDRLEEVKVVTRFP